MCALAGEEPGVPDSEIINVVETSPQPTGNRLYFWLMSNRSSLTRPTSFSFRHSHVSSARDEMNTRCEVILAPAPDCYCCLLQGPLNRRVLLGASKVLPITRGVIQIHIKITNRRSLSVKPMLGFECQPLSLLFMPLRTLQNQQQLAGLWN